MNVSYRRLKEYLAEDTNFDGVEVCGPGPYANKWSTKYVEKILDDGTFYVGEEVPYGNDAVYNFAMVNNYVNSLSDNELDKPITFIINNVKWKIFTQGRIFSAIVHTTSAAQLKFKTDSYRALIIAVFQAACVRI